MIEESAPPGAAPPVLSWDRFAGGEGTVFRVLAADDEVELALEKAEPLPPSGREGGSFRLEFRGPSSPLLAQGIYPFGRDTEAVEIFIVPVARDATSVTYEAIFF